MLKNWKRLMGWMLAVLFAILCLLIVWEHWKETKQVRTFDALTDFVEEQKRLNTNTPDAGDVCMSLHTDEQGKPVMKRSLPSSMMIASAAPVTGTQSQLRAAGNNDYLVVDHAPSREVLPQYAALHAQNPDFFGWIRIEGTKVNYPVMFSPKEPERYLYKDFYGNYAKYGVPFIDGSTDVEHSLNLLIHGHNARNGILFGDLDRFLTKAFFDKHRYIQFDTLYEEREYEIIAVCRTSIQTDGSSTFPYYDYASIWDTSALSRYLKHAGGAAVYAIPYLMSQGDETLTLSTCAYHKKDGRLLVIGKRIK